MEKESFRNENLKLKMKNHEYRKRLQRMEELIPEMVLHSVFPVSHSGRSKYLPNIKLLDLLTITMGSTIKGQIQINRMKETPMVSI